MLKRARPILAGPIKSRAGNPTLRPLFKPAGATHLYSAKDNASLKVTSLEATQHGLKGFLRLARERGTQYYMLGTFFIGLGVVSYLRKKQEKAILEGGLAGAPQRAFASRLVVVFDVDETLVSYGDKAYRLKAGVVPRPYLAELLDYLVTIDAEVILWSSCSEGYMREIMSVLDPTHAKISATITRHTNWYTADNYYEKNIAWLKRDPANTLIIENRALSVRNCNANAILVDDFIRGEYIDTGIDLPKNDRALLTIKEIISDLHRCDTPVPDYLADRSKRHIDIKEIPCERAIRQLRDEIARGVFYFVGEKFIPGTAERVGYKASKNLASKA